MGDHPNDDYIGGTSGETQGPPIPPEVFPSELAASTGQSPEQGGSTSSGGDTAPEVVEGGSGSELKPVGEMNGEELKAELGDDVPTEGSGANGNVVVEDLRTAVATKRDTAAG